MCFGKDEKEDTPAPRPAQAASPRASQAGSQRIARPASTRSKTSEKKRQEKESQAHESQQPQQQGESSAPNGHSYAAPTGPPPGHGEYAPPSGPPPPQAASGNGYAPPSGPPPPAQYAAPSSPPPQDNNEEFAPPPGPPPGFSAPPGPPPGQYSAPSGPPPSHDVNGGYEAPSGPPPGQYNAPTGPPPGQDYEAPSGPPPGFSAPLGPPPGHASHDAPERPVRLLPDGSYAPPESRTLGEHAPPPGPPPGHGQFALPISGPPPHNDAEFAPPSGPPPGSRTDGGSAPTDRSFAPPAGPPPSGDFAPPPGPPPSGDNYGPPAGPPPGIDNYGPPAGPPPGGDYAPPPGPPPSDEKNQHNWQHAVPDTSLFPPPPAFFSGFERSPANNASEQEAEAGRAWCDQYPLIQPVPLPLQAHQALGTHNINLMQPQGFRGTLAPSATVPGTWEGRTDSSAQDSCIIGYPPLYSAHAHSPLVTGRPVRIYYEVHIRQDSRPDEVDLALGFTALPYPNFRMPGWHRGSLAVHGDDGHKYINDWAGGHSFTEPFRVGETLGIGMSLSPRGDGSINVDVFFTRDGKIVGSWNLHEEGDAEEDLPVTGLEGFHDLSCAIGTFNQNSFEIIFEPSRWKYQDARESVIAGEGQGWGQ
ncbi:hypothetical protein ACHAQA_004516 [Verticillium albo-atrum]